MREEIKHYLVDIFKFTEGKAEELMDEYPEYMDTGNHAYNIAEDLNEQFEQHGE